MTSPVARLALPYFPTLSQEVRDLIQKMFEHKICVLIFSTLFCKTLLILKSSGRKYQKMCLSLHVKYPSFCQILIII